MSLPRVFEKWIKNGCHKPENRFPLAGISFPKQKYFFKTGFRLILITVSTSINKSCKILFCRDLIVYFCLEFFARENHY